MLRRTVQLVLAFVMIMAATLGGVLATAAPAQADECYSWSRTLSEGMSGADVTQLQIRVAGHVD